MAEAPTPGEAASVVSWLHRQALEGVDAGTILEGLCARLLAGGLDLERAVVGFLVFHPQFDAINFSWARDTGTAERQSVTRADIAHLSPSPFSHMQCTGTEEMRYRLDDSRAPLPFPALEQLRSRGLTDYLAFFQPFGSATDPRRWPELPGGVVLREGITGSFGTVRAGGFGEDELAALRALAPPLAVTVKAVATFEMTESRHHLSRPRARRPRPPPAPIHVRQLTIRLG
jgi:adenylate cyclase